MARHAKPGRNDLCTCGSGKKYKHCCEKKTAARRGRTLLVIVAAVVLGSIAVGVWQFRESSSIGPAPGLVWSPEHGHYH